MIIDKKAFLSIYMLLIFLFFTLDLNSPFIFYGNLLIFIPILVLFRFIYYPKVSVKKIVLTLFLIFFWEILIYIQSFSTLYDNLILNSQRSVFLFISMFLISDLVDKIDKEIILKSLNYYIAFLSLIVVLQFLGVYIFGLSSKSVDVSVLLGGEVSRSEYMDDLYRPTGLMSEPAAFVGAQIALLSLQYIMSKKNDFYRFLGIFSVLLSLSFAGFILVAIYSIIVFTKNIKNFLTLILIAVMAFIGLSEVIKDRLEVLGSDKDGSNNVKFEALQYFFSDPMHIFFGYGNIVRTSRTPIFFEGATDITFFFAIIAIFGVFVGGGILLGFITWLFRSKYNYKEKVVILLPLIKLTNPALIFFSCFIFLILSLERRDRQ